MTESLRDLGLTGGSSNGTSRTVWSKHFQNKFLHDLGSLYLIPLLPVQSQEPGLQFILKALPSLYSLLPSPLTTLSLWTLGLLLRGSEPTQWFKESSEERGTNMRFGAWLTRTPPQPQILLRMEPEYGYLLAEAKARALPGPWVGDQMFQEPGM